MILKQLEKDYKLNENDLFIARYILEHSEEIPLLSSHQLAKETFTSPTAIIRFVKKIGFESYNDFKLNIHSFLNQYYLSNMHIQSHENLYSVKNKLTEIECGIIHQTKDNIDPTTFNYIVSIISKNKYIDIIANDTNSTIGDYASHLLSSVNKIVNVYHNHDKQLWLSFNVEKDQVLVTGMPRIDTLLNRNERDEFFLKYPELKDKKLCLYAPTFRGNIIDGFKIQSFDFTKIKDYIVLYKFHPLLGDIQCKGGINMNKEDLYTLMQVSDCLISDYSSVIFDYSLLNKPMISYIPDINEYKQNIGLNIDFSDFPGPICTDENQLIEALKFEDYDYDKLSYFQMKYMVYTDGKNTSRVVDTIHQIMEEV